MKNKDFYNHYKNVKKNAEHHAPSVTQVIEPIALAILSFADEEQITTARKSKKIDGFTNPVKFRKNGVPYYVSYRHEISKIVVCEKNSLGRVLFSFDNQNSKSVMESFESL